MLSVLISTEHSYPALPLARQLADQRFVHPGPLVLGTTLLKFQRPHQIWTNLSHACYSSITSCIGLDLHLDISRMVNVQSLRALALLPRFPRYCPTNTGLSTTHHCAVLQQQDIGFHRNKLTMYFSIAREYRRVYDVFYLGIQTVQKPNNPFLFQFRC